jgi:hypothetical protein
MTRGEVALVAWIFALVYVAGLLPKIAARLAGGDKPEETASRKGE